MVRLGNNLACAALLVVGLIVSSREASAQATNPRITAASPAAQPASVAKAQDRSHHKKAAPVVEAPQAPAPPATLEQSQPTAPHVSYLNGQLTIDAANSTLSQVLRAVQSQTGASMDIPAAAGSERVVAQLGPGRPSDVLNILLNGSKFDYVILGVTGSPGAVQRVILTPRQSGPVSGGSSAQNTTPIPQESAADEEPPDEGIPVADTVEPEYQNPTPPEQQPPPPGGFRRPMPPGGQFAPQQNPFGTGESQNVVKTPEQLMQELQQMQQQQQQYQEQLNPANQTPQ